MPKQTKRQQTLAKLDSEKLYTVDEALSTLREYKSKFDERSHVKEQDVKNLAPKARVTRKDVWPNLDGAVG